MTTDDPDRVYAEASAWFRDHWDPLLTVRHWWRLLADAGYAFPGWPEGYGGRGLGTRAARAAAVPRLRPPKPSGQPGNA